MTPVTLALVRIVVIVMAGLMILRQMDIDITPVARRRSCAT